MDFNRKEQVTIKFTFTHIGSGLMREKMLQRDVHTKKRMQNIILIFSEQCTHCRQKSPVLSLRKISSEKIRS